MNRTKGVSTSNYRTVDVSQASTIRAYFTRFVSQQLMAGTITAQTWTYNFGARQESTSANFPVSGANQPVYICLYVWRPGTGKVGTIYEGNSSSDADECATAGNAYSEHVTFSGSAVTVQDNDVLIFEVWFQISTGGIFGSYQIVFIYDGQRADILNSGTSIGASLDYAAFIETPQNIFFQGDAINVTVTEKEIKNKFIVKNS